MHGLLLLVSGFVFGGSCHGERWLSSKTPIGEEFSDSLELCISFVTVGFKTALPRIRRANYSHASNEKLCLIYVEPLQVRAIP